MERRIEAIEARDRSEDCRRRNKIENEEVRPNVKIADFSSTKVQSKIELCADFFRDLAFQVSTFNISESEESHEICGFEQGKSFVGGHKVFMQVNLKMEKRRMMALALL